jgi:membrane fusion protein (multidrug efflux system)
MPASKPAKRPAPNHARVLRLVGLSALLLGGCQPPPGGWGGQDGKKPDGPAEEQATPVVVVPVAKGEIEASIAVSSTIEAERQVTVHAEATGRIVKLDIEEGEDVKEGQLLARVKYDAQSSGLERADSTLAKAEADLERLKQLFARGAASQEEVDNMEMTVRNARIDRADRNRDVTNTRVRAPFSGTLTERVVNEGAFVTSGQQLFSIVDFDTLVARVYVPEKELDRIGVGQEAQIVGKAAKGRKGMGTVARIAPVVDAATGTVKVTITLPTELSGAQGFLPGMYAEVTLTTERRGDVVLVPKPALVRDEDQTYVFVVDGDRATRRLIELGLSDENRVQALSGVKPGDNIIIAGQAGLKDGALVELVDASGHGVDVESGGDGRAGRRRCRRREA